MKYKNIMKPFAAALLTATLILTASCSADEYAKSTPIRRLSARPMLNTCSPKNK